jgi:hypothetical protein
MGIWADPFSWPPQPQAQACKHRVAKLYALLRSRFTVAQGMHLITKVFPLAAEALALLASFLAANPKTSFRLFRPEDTAMTRTPPRGPSSGRRGA